MCKVANCYDYKWNGRSADDIDINDIDNSINIETNNLRDYLCNKINI